MKHKKLFAILTLVCFMFTLMPVAAMASDKIAVVSTENELKAAITTASAIQLNGDINVISTLEIPAGKTVSIDLAGNDITANGISHLIHIANTATLNISDSSTEESGVIELTTTGNGSTINVEGELNLYSGTISFIDKNYSGISYGVEVQPNAWGTAYTKGTVFNMYGGSVISDTYGIRIASYSSETYEKVSATFIMNGGEISSTWACVFVQQPNETHDKLTVEINNGKLANQYPDYYQSLQVYGPAATSTVGGVETPTNITVHGGEFVGPITVSSAIGSELNFEISGGTFSVDPSAYVDKSVYCVGEKNSKYSVAKHELVAGAVTAPTCTEDGYTTYACENCGVSEKKDPVKTNGHVYDQEVATADYLKTAATACGEKPEYYKSCTCGAFDVDKSGTFEAGTALGHTFNKEVVDAKYLKSAADCENAAVYYKSCECGVASTTETFTNGEALGHDYGDWTAVDITTHKKVCKNDAAHVVTGDHDFNAENKCNACGLQKYIVTFKNVENETKVEVISGEVVAAPEDPTLTGMTFEGWYSDAEYKTKYDFATPVTADITLHAKWKDNSNAGGNGGDSYVGGGSSSSSSSNKTESSTTTTVTPSGDTVKVETETKTESDGTKVETETTTTTTTTGETTKVETTTETKTDGTVVETTTTTDSKGEVTTVEKTTETNDEGTKVETTVTTDAQGETATTVTATLDNGSAVTNNDEAVKVEVTKVEETVVTKVEEAVAADETVEVVGTADNAVSVSATNSSTGAAQSNFVQPMSVNVPVDKAVLDNVTDTSKLTMAKVVTNEDGTTELVYMGGSYDEETGTFNAKVDEDGDYILVEKADLVKIELTIDDTTVKHNDNHHEMDVAPKINAEEGRTELPLRYLGEALGFGIDWNNNVVTITKGDISFDLTIGKEIPGFGTPYIDSDRTMVSARYISEMLGANVIWDPIDRQVIVVK